MAHKEIRGRSSEGLDNSGIEIDTVGRKPASHTDANAIHAATDANGRSRCGDSLRPRWIVEIRGESNLHSNRLIVGQPQGEGRVEKCDVLDAVEPNIAATFEICGETEKPNASRRKAWRIEHQVDLEILDNGACRLTLLKT